MARDVNTDNVVIMIRILNESNASHVRGLSIPELSESTGLTRYVIKTIFDRPEYGFVKARGRSGTGADTYYHDVTQMTNVVDAGNQLRPLDFGDEARLEILIHNLVTALNVADPMNAHVAQAAANIARGGKGAEVKNYFDWFLDPSDMKFLQDHAKADKIWQGKTIRTNIDKQTHSGTVDEYISAYRRLAGGVRQTIDWSTEEGRETAIRSALGLLYASLKIHREESAIQRAEALRDLSSGTPVGNTDKTSAPVIEPVIEPSESLDEIKKTKRGTDFRNGAEQEYLVFPPLFPGHTRVKSYRHEGKADEEWAKTVEGWNKDWDDYSVGKYNG